MLSRIDLRGQTAATLSREKLDGVLPRAALDVEAALAQVRPVCEDVRLRGGAAVRDYTLRFDGVDLATTKVGAAALADALATVDRAVRAALEEAIRRTRRVHEAQRPADHVTTVAPGATVTERYVPVGRAGVYVPGGLVTYPSSVIGYQSFTPGPLLQQGSPPTAPQFFVTNPSPGEVMVSGTLFRPDSSVSAVGCPTIRPWFLRSQLMSASSKS